jgi:2-polyprenyl-6-hydroxyphenyl methylase / 3-demethylubiquinone-9 3-methyltransferase
VPIDNELYNAPGDIWWDDDQILSMLRTSLNPARFGYFREVLLERLRIDPSGKEALDIGCGGGLLAEEFSRLGCRVTGIDPSESSLQTARVHAQQSGLDISYLRATGEDLQLESASFDIVFCCDVLEHVDDLSRVIAETARVLKPGGIYFFDTINRTWRSKLVAINLAQEWAWSAILPARLHEWKMFVKPRELRSLLRRYGIELREATGMKPAASPFGVVRAVRQYKSGLMTCRELGERVVFKQSRDCSISYMGYGVARGIE